MANTKSKLTFVEYLEYDNGTDNSYELLHRKLQILPPRKVKQD